MLLQAVVSVALIAILAGALLASALVDVKVAANQAAARLATTALARGQGEFVNWAQRYVAAHGASTAWPATGVTDTPVPACAAGAPCTSFVTIAYAVSGSSANATSGPDPAQNLQSALNENRIAGTVTATITDAAGNVLSSRTRFVTIRVFDASPFAVLTGARDATAMAGPANAAEGDTGGYRGNEELTLRATPNPLKPAAVQDTSLNVTMDCSNSTANNNQSRPFNDDHSPGNDSKLWGTSGGAAFETPCNPTYAMSLQPTIPTDATLPSGNVYSIGIFSNPYWSIGSRSLHNWAP